jgi:hypothetical protein
MEGYMKFMIINRPTGHNSGNVSGKQAGLRNFAKEIRKMLSDGDIECAYHMVGGGHVYVVDADTIEQLQLAVRKNPLFEESHTEVIPVTDAADFLEHYADHQKAAARA